MPATLPTEYIYIPDVLYASPGGLERRLQLIVPLAPSGRRDPLVVYIPGAAWLRQEMYNDLPKLSRLAETGCAVASVQVREADTAHFPAQTEDIAAAVSFLREHAAQFRLDPDRVFLMGNSSGGHLALMAMLTADVPDLRGVIDLYGPTDLLLCASEPCPAGIFSEGRPSERLLGVRDLPAHPEAAARASCAMYITPDRPLPPVLILHGDADGQVSVEHSRRLYQQLTETGHEAAYMELPDAGHGGMVFWSGEALRRIAAFVGGDGRCSP